MSLIHIFGLMRRASKFHYHIIILIFLFLSACTGKNKQTRVSEPGNKARIKHATGFSINYFNDYTLVKVNDPWDSTKILHQYVLIDRNKAQPEKLPEGTIVKVPVEKIACFYSLDASIIETLGAIDKVKAIAETEYVKLPSIVKGLKNGTITDIGNISSLNIERLMDVSPDIVIVSPFQNSNYGKLETIGISIIENASYMETTPLGRAEWIRFIAAFLKKDKEAENFMHGIEERYTSLKNKVMEIRKRPTILSEKRYGQVWYIPGGGSYMSYFYKDAGGDYIWKDDYSTGSLSLDFETVYENAENADFWIIKTDQLDNYDDLKKEYEPYSYFKAWKEKKIIICNTKENNYYEEGTMNPDIILADLIHIFHPEILPGRTNKYFKYLNEK